MLRGYPQLREPGKQRFLACAGFQCFLHIEGQRRQLLGSHGAGQPFQSME